MLIRRWSSVSFLINARIRHCPLETIVNALKELISRCLDIPQRGEVKFQKNGLSSGFLFEVFDGRLGLVFTSGRDVHLGVLRKQCLCMYAYVTMSGALSTEERTRSCAKYLDSLFSDTTASPSDDDDFPSQVGDVVNRKL